MSTKPEPAVAHAWVSLRAEDPEAASALAVARGRLAAARGLRELRRYRVFELRGALPEPAAIADLLHRSIQFYNPGKERCVVRASAAAAAPVADGEAVALVVERGGDRRPAAERWWRHEVRARVEVREATAWVLRFEPGADAAALAADLAEARDRAHGLFANPHAQLAVVSSGPPPLGPWPGTRRRGGTSPAGGRSS